MKYSLFLPCAGGVEEWLADEAMRLLGPQTAGTIERGGIALEGDWADVMKLNIGSRLAQRVLVRVAHGPYRLEDDLYQLAREVWWPGWISTRQTFRIDVTAQRSPLKSLNFAALKVKDALCDVMREEFGERPNVDTQRPEMRVMLHLAETHATLYVDTSGEPLFKRGWREDKGEAPLKETLAAAMLAAAGWQGRADAGGALLDPCCGSGTIPIEAAQIACGIAPGFKRRFAFERLSPFAGPQAREQWAVLKAEAQARIHAPEVPVFASDVTFRMVDFARRNAERAGVAHAIQFNAGDALQRPAPRLPEGLAGAIMLNPPYGERIAAAGTAASPRRREADGQTVPDAFFAGLAAHWKRAFTGGANPWTAWVLSPEMKLPGLMRLKESRRIPMWNGPIECRLFRFDLVAGSARGARAADARD